MHKYSPRIFLPEEHKNSFGIASEVEKSHRELAGKMSQECINDVIEGCRKLSTMRGVFFEVSMPVKSEILAVIPWNKMEKKWFGVNKLGIFGIEKSTGEVSMTREGEGGVVRGGRSDRQEEEGIHLNSIESKPRSVNFPREMSVR